MITKLWLYFGVIGIASIVAWVAALIIFMRYLFHPSRTAMYRIGMGLVAIAWVFGIWNSANVDLIREDEDSAGSAAQLEQERLREQARDILEEQAARIRFAEDTDDDRLDLGGVDTSINSNIYELAAAGKDVEAEEEEDVPAWKRGGPRTRDASKKQDAPDADIAAGTGAGGDEQYAGTESDEDPNIRKLPAGDVVRANLTDRLNRSAIRYMLLIGLIALGFDYLVRFNSTFASVLPLPIASRLVDAVAEKSHSVYLQTGDSDVMRRYLFTAVRKGESFVYFGHNDPIGSDPLHRLGIGPLRLCKLPKMVYEPKGKDFDSKTVFDLVWHGRSCAVVIGPDDSAVLLDEVMDMLQIRRVPKATAWRSVSLVWDMGDLIPEESLSELVWLSEKANLRLVLVSPQPLSQELADLFDEYYTA